MGRDGLGPSMFPAWLIYSQLPSPLGYLPFILWLYCSRWGYANLHWFFFFLIVYKKNTTLQLFKKKISYRPLWCIISLPTKYTKESDPVRQTHYTTKRTWLVDFINIFPSILKRFLPLPRRLYSYWLYPYLPWSRRIPSVPSTDIFCLPSPKSRWLLFIMPVPTPKQTIPDSWM